MQERAHILEALKKALDFIDEVIAILRNSKSIAEGKEALMSRFDFDDVQAQAIVQMRLGQLTGLEKEKIEEELLALKEKIADYLDILSNESRVLAIVKEEAKAIGDKFGDERRTEIANVSGEVDIEDLIPEEECVYTMTTLGYIKRQPTETYQIQRRGGRGVKGLTRREEDIVETMFTCSTHDYVVFFTNAGRTYRLKGYEIPEGSRTSKGMNIVNLLPITQEEKVTAMIRVKPEEDDDKFVCMVTRNGIIKRTAVSEYKNVRKGGIIAVNLDEGDELAWVKLTSGEDDLLVATKKGMCIRFNEKDVRSTGRTSQGVIGMNLSDGDEIIGMQMDTQGDDLLIVSEKGLGKRASMEEFTPQRRGGKGVKCYKINAKTGNVIGMKAVNDSHEIMLISTEGIVIRLECKDISELGRITSGVKLIRMDEAKDITVASIAKVRDKSPEDSIAEFEAELAEEEENEKKNK